MGGERTERKPGVVEVGDCGDRVAAVCNLCEAEGREVGSHSERTPSGTQAGGRVSEEMPPASGGSEDISSWGQLCDVFSSAMVPPAGNGHSQCKVSLWQIFKKGIPFSH